MKYITCRGSVTGSCGTRHQTIGAAVRCCAAYDRLCRRQGGYSDRRAEDQDGERPVWLCDAEEAAEIEAASNR